MGAFATSLKNEEKFDASPHLVVAGGIVTEDNTASYLLSPTVTVPQPLFLFLTWQMGLRETSVPFCGMFKKQTGSICIG